MSPTVTVPAGPAAPTRPGEPRLLVLKIGGSVLSDKQDTGETDFDAIGAFAGQVADLIAEYPGRVVLVTGGGALCHPVGLRIKADRQDPYAAVALTEPAFTMRWAWTARLRERGVRAVPLQVTAMFGERADGSTITETGVVRRLLAEGALPVLSSDCVVTSVGTLRILSSDEVPALMVAEEFGPVRIVTLTDVPGILTGGPGSPSCATSIRTTSRSPSGCSGPPTHGTPPGRWPARSRRSPSTPAAGPSASSPGATAPPGACDTCSRRWPSGPPTPLSR